MYVLSGNQERSVKYFLQNVTHGTQNTFYIEFKFLIPNFVFVKAYYQCDLCTIKQNPLGFVNNSASADIHQISVEFH